MRVSSSLLDHERAGVCEPPVQCRKDEGVQHPPPTRHRHGQRLLAATAGKCVRRRPQSVVYRPPSLTRTAGDTGKRVRGRGDPVGARGGLARGAPPAGTRTWPLLGVPAPLGGPPTCARLPSWKGEAAPVAASQLRTAVRQVTVGTTAAALVEKEKETGLRRRIAAAGKPASREAPLGPSKWHFGSRTSSGPAGLCLGFPSTPGSL